MCGKNYPTIFTLSDNCTATTKINNHYRLFLTYLNTTKQINIVDLFSPAPKSYRYFEYSVLWPIPTLMFSIHVPNLPLCTRAFFPHHHVLPWVAVLIHVSLPHVFLPLFMSLLLPLFNKILIVIWPEGVILICHSSKGWNRFRGDEWWASYVSRYIGTSLNLT